MGMGIGYRYFAIPIIAVSLTVHERHSQKTTLAVIERNESVVKILKS